MPDSMKEKHFNIPVFIPDLACPFRCIYCHQPKITGEKLVPSDNEILTIIENHLHTIPERGSTIEIAFFGGNFTGLSMKEQEHYLKLVSPFVQSGKVSGIRLSTRPDCISREILLLLKSYNVSCIELGAQSMDNEVLTLSKRGHTAEDTVKASSLIRESGIKLGLQMMIGLPGDTFEKARATCRKLIELKPDCARLYPTLIIRDTYLEIVYREGKYKPLSLDIAISWSKVILPLFEEAGIKVLKAGLHPVRDLLNGKDLVAGPFHPSFRELVYTELWSDLLTPLVQHEKKEKCHIFIAPGQVNYAAGFGSKNRKMLEQHFKIVKFTTDKNLKNRVFYADIG